MIEIESKLSTIEWPFLTIHGEKDGLVKCVHSKKLYDRAASKDKTMTVIKVPYFSYKDYFQVFRGIYLKTFLVNPK